MYSPNVLNQYDTYSYNIELHQVHPRDLNKFGLARTEVIAKQGAISRYNIDSVEQVFTVGYGQVRQGFANQFNIDISEANGVTLFERIIDASQRLGIENHLQAKYFIKILFLGRDEQGRPKQVTSPFFYPVTFVNITTNVTAGGAQYTIKAVENSTTAFTYLTSVLKSQVVIEAGTLGEFIEKLTSRLNDTVKLQLQYNKNAIFADEYTIEFDDEISDWKQWKIQQTDEDAFVGNNRVGDKMQFVIPENSSMMDIISVGLQTTEEFKQIQLDDGTVARQSGSDGDVSSTLDKFKVFFKVIPNIEYTEYDFLQKDYAKKITYRIKKHIMPDEITESAEYEQSITNKQIQSSRIRNLVSAGLLQKRYDYYFTGRNTEVENFDIKLDTTYYLVSPVGGGNTGDPNTVQSLNYEDTDNILETISEIKKSTVNLRDQETSIQTEIDDLKNRNVPSYAFQQQTIELNRTREQIAARDSQLSSLIQTYRIQNSSIRSRGLTANPISGTGTTGTNNQEFVSAAPSFKLDSVPAGYTYAPENSRNGGNMQFGAVRANLESSADLIEIELKLRGDPYWLGKPNSFYTRLNNGDDVLVADYEKGGIMFYLNVNLPTDENAAGQRIPMVERSISGTYRVVNVIASYQGGKFVQYIKAVRDLATNTPTAKSALDNI